MKLTSERLGELTRLLAWNKGETYTIAGRDRTDILSVLRKAQADALRAEPIDRDLSEEERASLYRRHGVASPELGGGWCVVQTKDTPRDSGDLFVVKVCELAGELHRAARRQAGHQRRGGLLLLRGVSRSRAQRARPRAVDDAVVRKMTLAELLAIAAWVEAARKRTLR